MLIGVWNRIPVTSWFQALGRKTRTGILKRTEVLLFMVMFTYLSCDQPSLTAAYLVDTEGASATVDPLAALEKTTDAQNHLTNVQIPRLESLQTVSEHYNSDPYALSTKVRKRFREEKKIEQRQQRMDDHIKGRYGLPVSLSLVADDDEARQTAKDEWEQGKRELALRESSKRRKLAVEVVSIPTSSTRPATSSAASAPSRPLQRHKSSSQPKGSSTNALNSLRARILENTARQSNPFNKQRITTKPDNLVLRK